MHYRAGFGLIIQGSLNSPGTPPPKARFTPSQEGALGLFHLPTRLASLILAQYQRVLHAEGPTQANSVFLSALGAGRHRGEGEYSIARSYAQNADAVGCQVKGISPQTLLGQHFRPIRQPQPQGFPTDHLVLRRVDNGIHTHHYSHKPQRPIQADLIKHGCHVAAELISRFPDADIGYTDGSHVHKDHSGCAAVLDYHGEGGTITHAMRVRESSSYPAELWALYLVLVYARPSSALIILSDCSSALQKIYAIERGDCAFYSHTHAHILRKISHALRARLGRTYFAHIRSHVGFAGNEWADLFARLGAYVSAPPPPVIPRFHLHQRSILISGKPHYHLFRHMIPKHAHPDLHHRSFDIWRYSSFFSRLSFSWPNGLVNLPNYEFFNQIDDRHCSLCDQVHPFDALSCLAQCRHLSYARSLAFDVWPPPAQPIILDWYQTATRDDKRKFIRTLLPKSLITRLESINGLPLREILAFRNPSCPP